jgi:DNA modification methylase
MSNKIESEQTENSSINIREIISKNDLSDLTQDQLDEIKTRVETVGLWYPIHLQTDCFISDKDELYKIAALDALGVEELELIYDADSPYLAVPADQYSIDDDLARKAAKLEQGGNAAKAEYIVSFINQRVGHLLPEGELAPSRDDVNVHVKLLNKLDNVERADRDEEWPYGTKTKDALHTLLETVSLSPSRAREYAQAYTESHEDDWKAFRDQEISLEMLNTRRRIREKEIPEHRKESLLKWSRQNQFNAPQLSNLTRVAETGYTNLIDEVVTGNLSSERAKELARKASDRDLSEGECQTLRRKIRRSEKDVDEYLELKLPDDLEERFEEVTEGNWLESSEKKRYQKEVATRHDKDKNPWEFLEDIERQKENHFTLPDLPDGINEDEYEMELGKVLTQDEEKEIRRRLRQSEDPNEEFVDIKQEYQEERRVAKPLKERLEDRQEEVRKSSDTLWEQSLADTQDTNIHKAPPLVTQEHGDIQVFFHKSQPTDEHDGMLEEIAPNSVDLFFFSPPYYTQRGMKLDYLSEVDSVEDPHEEELTEAEIDAGFGVYLEEMRRLFKMVYKALKPNRYFILNISDHQVETDSSAPNKRYPISEFLVSKIYTELNQAISEDELNLQHIGKNNWFKTFSGVERASMFFEQDRTRGLPLYYYPEDRTEDLYIFRKGDAKQDDIYTEVMDRFSEDFSSLKEFKRRVRHEDPRDVVAEKFPQSASGDEFSQIYKTDTWIIPPDPGGHNAGFPLSLAKLVVQLYSLPGDRIADPTVGMGTTLKAVQEVNNSSPFDVKREGVGWEDFSGESAGQPDYVEELTRVLTSRNG